MRIIIWSATNTSSITALIRERERKSQSHFFFPCCLSQPNSHYLLQAAWKNILGLRYYRYKWTCRRLAICLKLHWIAFGLLWIPDVPYSSGCSHHKKGKWVCVLVIGWALVLVCFCLFEKNFTLRNSVPKPSLPNLPYPNQNFKKTLMEPTRSHKN